MAISTPIDQQKVQRLFPKLQQENFSITSLQTPDYNCIAWAARDTGSWWWPSVDGFWPARLPLVETVENFIHAFADNGFAPCTDGSFESGYEKVAIYVGTDGRVKHMSRQLNATTWTSKLGESWDIEHESPQGVEGKDYGTVAQYLKRVV